MTLSTAIENGNVVTNPSNVYVLPSGDPASGFGWDTLKPFLAVLLRSCLSMACPGSTGSKKTSQFIVPLSTSPNSNPFAVLDRSVTSCSVAVPDNRSFMVRTTPTRIQVSGDELGIIHLERRVVRLKLDSRLCSDG